MGTIRAKTPWQAAMGDIPMHLEYFEGSMFDKVKDIADRYPNYVAFDFMGRSTTYRKMVGEIEKCAGTQLDPKIVEVFLELYREHKFDSE